MSINIPKSRAVNTTPQNIQRSGNAVDKSLASKKQLSDGFENGKPNPTLAALDPKKVTGLPTSPVCRASGEGSDDFDTPPDHGQLPKKETFKKMGPEERYAEAVYQLGRWFSTVDEAYNTSGRGFIKEDDIIGLNDLEAIVNDPMFSGDEYKDLRRACRFLLEHPEYFTRLETAGKDSEFDGKIHRDDIWAEWRNLDLR